MVLAVGQHDADFVDAYYGPEAWRPAAGVEPRPIHDLRGDAARLIDAVPAAENRERGQRADGERAAADLAELRREYLSKQLQAVDARLRMLAGHRFTFDEESRALYDAVAPVHDESHFARILSELDVRIPGPGSLSTRHEAFKRAFVIARERLSTKVH